MKSPILAAIGAQHSSPPRSNTFTASRPADTAANAAGEILRGKPTGRRNEIFQRNYFAAACKELLFFYIINQEFSGISPELLDSLIINQGCIRHEKTCRIAQ